MKKIESLTAKQEKDLVAYREEWLAHGRSTQPADRTICESVFSDFYARLGKSKPKVLWFDGPATGSMARALLIKTDNLGDNLWDNLLDNLWDNLGDNLGANLGDNLWASLGDSLQDNLRDNLGANLRDSLRDNLGANLRDNLWDNLGANLGANLWANLRDNLWDNLGDNLGANLGDNLWANLRANLRDNLRDNLGANLGDNLGANLGDNLWANLRDNLRDNLGDNLWANLRDNLWDNLLDNLWDNLGDNLRDNLHWYFWGQHEAAWSAFYYWPHLRLRKMHSKSQMDILNGWLTLSKSCGWWNPFEGAVIACERPSKQAVDQQGRLHCEDGPALLCRDGWPVYSYHGVRVPNRVIENRDQLTWKDAQAETNAEIRQVMVQIIGAEKMLCEAGAKEVHRDDFGTLFQLPDGDRCVVKVVNSTQESDGTFKDYFLFVPPQMTRARQAVAWTFGMEEFEYSPAVQT